MTLAASLRERIDRIATDRERGAAALAAEAVRILADVPTVDRAEAARALASARPAMVSIANAVRLAERDFATSPENAIRDRAEAILATMEGWRRMASANAASLVPPGSTVCTISSSRTVRDALVRAAAEMGGNHVVIGESRPRLEGRMLASELAAAGIGVTVVTDAALVSRVASADLVLVGADAVLADGTLVHKVGTYPLALAAREAHVPVYAAADRTKFVVARDVAAEQDDPAALWPGAPPGIVVENPLFDRTPAALLAGLATDLGLVPPARALEIADGVSSLAVVEPPRRAE